MCIIFKDTYHTPVYEWIAQARSNYHQQASQPHVHYIAVKVHDLLVQRTESMEPGR